MKWAALIGLMFLALYCELLYRLRVPVRTSSGLGWSAMLIALAAVASIAWTGAVGWAGMRWIVAQIQ